MSKLQWEEVIEWGRVHWWSGIYKISNYPNRDRQGVPEYWQCYYIPPVGYENWGDYVNPSKQAGANTPTLAQCKEMCELHAQDYEPSKRQLRIAKRSIDTMRENP